MIKKIAMMAIAFATISSSAADLFPDGNLREMKAGDLIQPTDQVGGYPISQNDGNWRYESGSTSFSSGGVDPIRLGQMRLTYWWGRLLLATQTIDVNIGSGRSYYWSGSPCSPEHLVVRNKGRGRQDNCMTIDPVTITIDAKPVTFFNIAITNSGSNGRFYRLVLAINADLLGIRETGTVDWTEATLKAYSYRKDVIERLTAWAEQIQDGSIKAFDYSKPQDVYEKVPSLMTLLPVPEDLVGSKRSINFLSAVQHLRHLGEFKSIAYSRYEDFKDAWEYATDQPTQEAADKVAVAKCESIRSANRPDAPKCEVYRITEGKRTTDLSALQKQGAPVRISIVNNSPANAEIYWVNGSALKLYMTLAPGQAAEQHTYIGHQWRAMLSGSPKPIDFTASQQALVWELSVPGQQRLGLPVRLAIINNSPVSAAIYWLNGSALRLTKTLSPGQSMAENTYTGHQWKAILSGNLIPIDFTTTEQALTWELK